MFLCRHLLRRAYPSNRSFKRFYSAASSTDTRGLASLHRHVYSSPVRRALSDSSEGRGSAEKKPVEKIGSRLHDAVPPAAAPPHNAHKTPRPSAKVVQAAADTRLTAYFGVRDVQRKNVAQLALPTVLQAIDSVAEHTLPESLQAIADDLLEGYINRDQEVHDGVSIKLLSVCCQPWWRKARRQYIAQQVLQDFESRGELHKIPGDILGEVATTCLSHSPHAKLDMPILTIITAVLLRRLGGPRTVNFGYAKGLPKAQVVWILFICMIRLLMLGKQPQVLNVFKELVADGAIPSSALTGVDLTSSDFNNIILTVLVRTCLERDWHNRGAELITRTLNWQKSPTKALINLTESLIRALLNADKDNTNVEIVSALIVRFLNVTGQEKQLESVVVHTFYSRASRAAKNLPCAIAVYVATKQSRFDYPLPPPRDLNRFLRHCMEYKDINTARMLARQMVADDIDVFYIHRPAAIAFFAENGFTKEARALYERYAARRDAQIVVASPAVLMRLVSLCAARIRIFRNRIQQRNKLSWKQGRALYGRRWWIMRHIKKGDRRTSPSVRHSSAKFSSARSPSANVHPDSRYPDAAGTVTEHDGMAFEDRLVDLEAFANRVIDNYVESISPLEAAGHQQLNSLARAYLIMGRVKDAFGTLRIVLSRKEVPTINDVNVALSAMSAYNPKTAAHLLEGMINRGLQPDAVSFGTVIHHAHVHGDQALVEALMERASGLGIALDYKTLCTLIRGSATSDQSPEWHLQIVQKAVDNILELGVVPSPKIGVDCVYIALRSENVHAAMWFWRNLVRDKEDFHDYKQLNTRRRIATLIEEQYAAGKLSHEVAVFMRRELDTRRSKGRQRRHRNSTGRRARGWGREHGDETGSE